MTRAVLPVMRNSARHVTISSSAAWAGSNTSGACRSKFVSKLDGVNASRGHLRHPHDDRQPGVLPHGATERSTNGAALSIKDYDERRAAQIEFWKSQNGKQSGDPAKLAKALLTIASQEPPPRRFIAGADAIGTAEQKIADLQADISSNRALSTSLDFD
jgi:hypothetical protein